MPPFSALRAFEAVGRFGTVRRAAVSLSLDHTVVSRHVRALENWLGIALFVRRHDGLGLTAEGEAYHRRISAALFAVAEATSEIIGGANQDHLRIWCVPGFAAQWLSERLAEFEQTYPGLTTELRPTDIAANLVMHEADIDIRYYGDDWEPKPGGRGVRHIELVRPAIMAVANPELAARLAQLKDISELVQAPLLHEEHNEQWRSWFRHNGVVVEGPMRGPLLWHAHLAIAAARQGRGVALVSTYLIAKDLENGSLVELTAPGARKAVIGGYAFVAREDRWSAPSIMKLRQFLQSKVV